MGKYDSPAKRKIGSYNIMKLVKDYNDETTNLTNQTTMLLRNYADIDVGDDAQNRLKLLGCCSQISGAADEMKAINNKYFVDVNGLGSWVYTSDIYLDDYIPPIIDKIEVDGREIPMFQSDIRNVFKIIFPYRSDRIRGTTLNSGTDGFYYDDYEIMPRTITIENPIYASVLSDIDISQDWKKTVNTYKSYDTVVKDKEIIQWDTSPDPVLPSPEDITKCLLYNENREDTGILPTIRIIKNIKKMNESPEEPEDYYSQLECSPSEMSYSLVDKIIYGEGKTKEWAERVYNTLPEEFYYEFSDGTFMMLKVTKKSIVKIDPSLITKYEPEYETVKDLVKHYIYNNKDVEDYYKNFKYEVHLTLREFAGNYLDDKVKATPTNSVTDKALMKVMDSLKLDLESGIYGAKKAVDSTPEESRCLEFEPVASYEFFYNFISAYKAVNVQQCNRLISWVTNTLEPWVNKRAIALKSTISDINNATILINLHKKRLTKGSGSFLMWYQSIAQLDNSYNNYLNTKEIAKNMAKNILIAGACDNPDQRMFYNYYCPDYIDLNPIDPVFTKGEFNTGDTIYIINDLYEQENKIDRITTIEVASTDIADIDMEALGKGDLMGGVTNKTIPITRLYLKYPLKPWCQTEELEDLRIVKIL